MQPFQDLCGPTPSIDWSGILAKVQSVLQIVTILVTATWAYLRYIRGRELKGRIEPTVSGSLFRANDQPFITVSVGLKNIGLWGVTVEQRGTGLVAANCTQTTQAFLDLPLDVPVAFSIFENHTWIAPGESIQDKLAFPIPSDAIAVKLTLQFVSKGICWTAVDFVSVMPKASKTAML